MKNDVLGFINDFKSVLNEKSIKPHRFALLLAISKLFENDPNSPKKLYLNEKIELSLKDSFLLFSSISDASSAIIQYPYFHLQTSGYWSLHIIEGKEKEYKEIIDLKNARFTKLRLKNLVSQASINKQ